MISCPHCPYTYTSRKSDAFTKHNVNEHLDRYWVLEKTTKKVIFTLLRETPTSALQCKLCPYSTKNFRRLCEHLKRDHVLGAFATTTQLQRVMPIPPPSNGVKLELKDEVKDVISILVCCTSFLEDSDDESDVVIFKPKKAQSTSTDRGITATGPSQQSSDSAASTSAVPVQSKAEVPAINSNPGNVIVESSQLHQKPPQGTVPNVGSSSQKRALDADVSVAPPPKRRIVQDSSPERPPNTEMTVRDPSVRKTEAMERVQRLETGLSDRCVVVLIDLFQEDVSAADAYLALTREGVRKQWIADRVRHIKDNEDEML